MTEGCFGCAGAVADALVTFRLPVACIDEPFGVVGAAQEELHLGGCTVPNDLILIGVRMLTDAERGDLFGVVDLTRADPGVSACPGVPA